MCPDEPAWPAQAVIPAPSGGGPATTPTVLLDSYYDSPVFASKSAAIQAAYVAAASSKAVLEFQAKRVYSLDTAALHFNPSTPITIEGHGATLQANWGKPRCIDYARTADYQSFTDNDVRDLIFDANNLTAATAQSVVGNLIDGGGIGTQRVNIQRNYYRRCQWINVPFGAAGVIYACLALNSRHVAAGETQTNLTDIRVEQAIMRGGNIGAEIAGTSGTTVGVEVFHDNIYVDVDHDTGVVPTGATIASSHVQIGSIGFGNRCEVHVVGANSGDVGVEIDGMQTADVYGQITDSRNTEFFARNFHAPPHPASQRLVCHSCAARVINIAPDSTGVHGVGFSPGATSAPNPPFGEMVLENCSYYSAAATFRDVGMAIKVVQNALVGKLTIAGGFRAVLDSINETVSASSPSVVALQPAGSAFTLSIGGQLSVNVAGVGNASLGPRLVVLSPQTGCKMRVLGGEIDLSDSLTSMGATKTSGLLIGLGGGGGGTIRGKLARVGWGTYGSDDATPQLLIPRTTTDIGIDGQLVIDQLDFYAGPVAAPAILAGAPDVANKSRIYVRNVLTAGPYPSAAMSASNFAAAAFTTAVGNQYIGSLPADIQFATGTGAGITAIDVSKDGTTYENAYTQASGAMAQSVTIPVDNGDFIRVTFATTQPTTRVRFRRAQ